METKITLTNELINTIADKIWLYKMEMKEATDRFWYNLRIWTYDTYIVLEISQEQWELVKSLIKSVHESKKSDLVIIKK